MKLRSKPTPEKHEIKKRRAQLKKERQARGVKKLFIIKNGKRVPVQNKSKNSVEHVKTRNNKEDSEVKEADEVDEDNPDHIGSPVEEGSPNTNARPSVVRPEESSEEEQNFDNENIDSQKDLFETEMWEEELKKKQKKKKKKHLGGKLLELSSSSSGNSDHEGGRSKSDNDEMGNSSDSDFSVQQVKGKNTGKKGTKLG